jgi:heterodisulfide reductase subunit A
MSKIGVFVCHCGENIARTVDCERVVRAASRVRGVAFATDYKYMCSDPGQTKIKKAVAEFGLTGVVVAACSPHMHEKTFRKAVEESGVNPFLCEMANIREHCSWVHERDESTTQKAIELVRLMVEKAKRNASLTPVRVKVTKRALVIGGGVAGIQAALDIADGGHEVVLVEKEPSVGGHMAQLSETFPTLDCSQCILTPKMVDVGSHPRIKLHTYSEVEKVEGFVGNFKVTIRKKARSVDINKCTGCGECQMKCPSKKIPSEFDRGLKNRTAIYIPFPQAVPARPVIDREHCIYFTKGKCKACQKVCPADAVDFEQTDEFVEEMVGGIVVATGFDLYTVDKQGPYPEYLGYGEYGYGKDPDILDGLQFERLASASGPTGGKILRPSDGKEPKSIVFLKCIGSRHPSKGIFFCSKTCCMYTAKHTMLYKHKVHDGQAYVFYMDIRSPGKNYDEFVRRAIEEEGAIYLRGRVSRIYRSGDLLIVKGADTLSGAAVEVEAEMVVLATAMMPQPGVEKVFQKLGISYDEYKWASEAHPKLRPVECATAGIFLAGACQGPKDIPEAVAQASGAACKVLIMFSQDEMLREPVVAKVNENTCIACWYCLEVCPYKAISKKEIRDRKGNLIKRVAEVNPSLCTGCGTCAATCFSNSVDLDGFTDEQLYSEINSLMAVGQDLFGEPEKGEQGEGEAKAA